MNPLRNYQLKHRYGIDLYDYRMMYCDQDGCCACCGKPQGKNSMVVDHDHETGEVRGLLCSKCNSGLGLLGDTIPTLLRALKYLIKGKINNYD